MMNPPEKPHSQFKKDAKKHQIEFRKKYISKESNTHETWLTDDDAKKGKNFYHGFSIFDTMKNRSPKFYPSLYSDMLRSEHIPYNLFIPFRQDLVFCKNVFNKLLGNCIKAIDEQTFLGGADTTNIKIEFAPKPNTKYLGDRTSFDAYIEYTHKDNTKGIIGIEVKYTEREYKLKKGSTEEKTVRDQKSAYYKISEASKIYKPGALNVLPTDNFRQIWRNQMLAEKIKIEHKDRIFHSTSMTFFPSNNKHFVDTSKEYLAKLIEPSNKFVAVTYENFIAACMKCCPPNKEFENWIDYLSKRYLIPD
jgi:hypothetical protein